MTPEEKEYPIWVISARWNNLDYKNNSTSFTVSYRRNYSDKVMFKKAEKWWIGYCKKKYPNETPELLSLKVESLGKDIWYGVWFSHKSLNRFETEKEAFESLRRYEGTLKKNTRDEYDNIYTTKNGHDYCPMGLQDDWRWKYCECKSCKRLNQTIISH